MATPFRCLRRLEELRSFRRPASRLDNLSKLEKTLDPKRAELF